MKKIIFITLSAFCTAFIWGYATKAPTVLPLSPDCYVSCFSSAIMEEFRAEAITPAFGNMHDAPKVYEHTNALGKTIQFKAADGTEAIGYEIRSNQKSNVWLFVIQEWWGLNEYIKKESDTYFTNLGNVNVIALDLYDGKVAATADSAMKLIQGAKTERLESIIKGAIAYAGADARIMTVGWCFGGMWSLQSSLLAGKQAAGCVMFYGRPENNIEKLKGLNCDVIGFFGTKDRSPSPEVVARFEADMKAAGKQLTVHQYDAGHGFANPSNPSFNKEATADSYAKALAFLRSKK